MGQMSDVGPFLRLSLWNKQTPSAKAPSGFHDILHENSINLFLYNTTYTRVQIKIDADPISDNNYPTSTIRKALDQLLLVYG